MYEASNTKVCPFLRAAQDKATVFPEPTAEHCCYAKVDSFSPSAVQQSSCCFNAAIFARCPYYVAANEGTAQPVGVTAHRPRRESWLAQMGRIFSFGRKKRRRIYYS